MWSICKDAGIFLDGVIRRMKAQKTAYPAQFIGAMLDHVAQKTSYESGMIRATTLRYSQHLLGHFPASLPMKSWKDPS
jgi:hypothetical protein